MNHLCDLHKGETCVIIGNGPSLASVPNDMLAKFATFGTNRIYLKYVPTYYVAVNPLVINQYKNDIENLDTTRFLTVQTPTSFFLRSWPVPLFSYDPTRYIYEGYTVTFVCLQLAFFMGFTTVKLVGVDHDYVYEGEPNEKQVLQGDDPNHFDPNYFKDAMWNLPDLKASEHAYRLALQAFEKDGRQIINCTPESKLDVFDFGDLI